MGHRQRGVRRLTRAAALALALACCLQRQPVAAQDLLDRVLAVVSGTVITLSDARAAADFGFVETRGARDPVAAALKWLIERQLVLDEATRYEPVEPDMVSVEAALVTIRGRFASDAAWRQALARLGLDEDALRNFVGETLVAESYVSRRFEAQLTPSDDELRAFYDRHRDAFTQGGRLLAFDEARPTVEALAQRERRALAIADWIARLRRRAEVSELYVASR